jgi:hypothetical protein
MERIRNSIMIIDSYKAKIEHETRKIEEKEIEEDTKEGIAAKKWKINNSEDKEEHKEEEAADYEKNDEGDEEEEEKVVDNIVR